MTIDDLRTSISEMTDERALDLVMDTRQHRLDKSRYGRRASNKKKQKKQAKAAETIMEAIEDMSAEEGEALLEALTNE